LLQPAPLHAYGRSLVLEFMRNVEDDQRWGVGVVADPGTTFANKNGWLSVEEDNPDGLSDDDRWLVNSVGIVTVHHQQVLMAVLTQHGADLPPAWTWSRRWRKLSPRPSCDERRPPARAGAEGLIRRIA
jgi:hypothetical protein